MSKFLQSLRGAKRRNLFKILNSLSRPTERCSLSTVPFPLPFGQAGQSTVYIIIIIIVILFAVMFAGGGASLFTGNEPSSVTDEPTPSTTAGGSGGPTDTPATSTLSHVFLGCGTKGVPGIRIQAFASEKGYMIVEIQNNTGGFDYYVGSEFIPAGREYGVALLNNKGFNTKKWRVRLFSGGSIVSGQWQGGTEKAVDPGDPTNCP